MPWDPVTLNDGRMIPSIAFGTWKLGSNVCMDRVEQAISARFNHIDTAQIYQNEAAVGAAIRKSGLPRSEIFITTKFAAMNGLDIKTSIRNSLEELGVSYVDLYLIHAPYVVEDIPTTWKEFEEIQESGLAKSIGVSNFGVEDLLILLASAKIKPVVNQIVFHPYVYAQQATVLKYTANHGIVIETYSTLISITCLPGGPVEIPVDAIVERLGATSDQILIAWARAKGAVVVTMSLKRERLDGYIAAGDLVLTAEDITSIDRAGIAAVVKSYP